MLRLFAMGLHWLAIVLLVGGPLAGLVGNSGALVVSFAAGLVGELIVAMHYA